MSYITLYNRAKQNERGGDGKKNALPKRKSGSHTAKSGQTKFLFELALLFCKYIIARQKIKVKEKTTMEKFYLGMDIGTNSVGMACTDENYKLLRAKGKDCWSVRLFDESKTALERRTYRTSRRRLQRRKYRLALLQELFAPFIDDKNFFIRLNNSQFLPEDKDGALFGDKNNLFNDPALDDKTFHGQFPTIYHLRKALIDGGDYDLRLYYLALHHIIKYRGHFLFEGSMNDIRNINRLFTALNDTLKNVYGDDEAPEFAATSAEKAKEILLDPKKNIRDKEQELEKLFGAESKLEKEIIKGMCGAKISPSVLFGESFKEEKSFSFKELTDESFDAMRQTYGDNFALPEALRAIYSFVTFEKLLVGKPDISSAMIAVYEKHKSDLKLLKDFLRAESGEIYGKVFKNTNEKANYVNYVGYTKKGGDKKKVKTCGYEEFRQYLKKTIAAIDAKDKETQNLILSELENGSFLPKILHSDNGLFPHQVNEDELVKIADNMAKNHPETTDMAKKLRKLFLFRVPYFVGPLAGENSWAVRKTDEKVTPWNFDDVIDKAASNEEFMRRMTNHCSILHAEDVLPKCSMIYQKYNVLNQLNKLKINDCPLPSVELKQKIFNELFLKYNKVSDKKIIDLLVRSGEVSPEEARTITLTGKDGELNASMSSYITFKNILGDFADKPENAEILEKIILWHTLNTDKKIVEDLILKHFGKISEIKNNVKALKGLVFKDFGRLSEKLLTGLKAADKETGELLSIIDILYETNQNLNEILANERYNFAELIKAENGEESDEIGYKDIEELYVSPAVRRGIWQSLIMADEYINAVGKVPDRIFIEFTRTDETKGEAGKKLSRKKQLSDKFKSIKDAEFQDIIAELNSDEITDMKLRQERLYLYFRQLGKCMYSGKNIDLSSLNTDNYDVDHILPRSYTKDDSLDNKALVLRDCNAKKADHYPVPSELRQVKLWKLLHEKELISKKTFDRLMRTEPLGEGDYEDFINRQKVITDQTAKAVAELLQRKYPTSQIVYSKAKNVVDFKNKFSLYKCRETNNLHHARDAYLNIVVGNVYHTCFSTPMAMFYKKDDGWRENNLKTMFTRNVKGAWDENSLQLVQSTFKKHTMAVSQYAFCYNGMFYDQTVYPKGDPGITAPRKGNSALADVEKYGGYKSQKTSYFAIVQSKGKKGQTIKTIEAVPVLTAYRQRTNPDALLDYFKTYLTEPTILIPKLKVRQLVSYNGTPVYIAGVTGDRIIVHNATELFTDNKTDEYVNQLSKLVEMAKNGTISEENGEYIIKTNRNKDVKLTINRQSNIELYDTLKNKLSKPSYQGLSPFSTFRKNLESGEEKFANLSVTDQCTVLLQILKFFKCNAETADIVLIGGSGRSGCILFNKDVSKADFKIICKSPAGLTERIKKV